MYAIIDNYDSFTHNLYQYLCALTEQPVRVFRNDRITVAELAALEPKGILVSPGPGRPEEAGISVEAVRSFAGAVPILGVCLGHQAIGAAFGGRIVPARRIVHGKTEEILLDGRGLFRGLPRSAAFTRYHSLVIERESLPAALEVTATSADGEIMGVRHREFAVEGVQFHPESVASEYGKPCIRNFLNYRREPFPASEHLSRLQSGQSLSREQAAQFMEELTEGDLTDVQIAAFLALLSGPLIHAELLAGMASVLRCKSVPFRTTRLVLDTCGTGGDGHGTFNISSLASLVAASAGATVAKHGNRGVSSPCGSADFFRELGVPVEASPKQSEALLEAAGFCFLFAPAYHAAMKHAARPRRELAIKSVMNLLGPLCNPAGAAFQIIGVYNGAFCEPLAEASRLLGARRVMVVHGEDGLDEISVCAPTGVVEIDERGNKRSYRLRPEEFHLQRFALGQLTGAGPAGNARLAREILEGRGSVALREAVLLNAGAALYICGIARNIGEGYRRARHALEQGQTLAKLRQIQGRARALESAA